jgi:hypothetical protein
VDDVFASTAQLIVATVSDLLEPTPLGRPSRMVRFHGRDFPADCCDAIGASWMRFDLDDNGPNTSGRGGVQRRKCGYPWKVGDLAVVWWRDCYPTLSDNPKDPFPDPDLYDEASVKLMADMEAVLGGLFCHFAPDGTPAVTWAGSGALQPMGGCAGWEIQLRVWMRLGRPVDG